MVTVAELEVKAQTLLLQEPPEGGRQFLRDENRWTSSPLRRAGKKARPRRGKPQGTRIQSPAPAATAGGRRRLAPASARLPQRGGTPGLLQARSPHLTPYCPAVEKRFGESVEMRERKTFFAILCLLGLGVLAVPTFPCLPVSSPEKGAFDRRPRASPLPLTVSI